MLAERGAEELDDAPGHPLGHVLDGEALAGQARRRGHRGRLALPPGDLLLELDDALAKGVEIAVDGPGGFGMALSRAPRRDRP